MVASLKMQNEGARKDGESRVVRVVKKEENQNTGQILIITLDRITLDRIAIVFFKACFKSYQKEPPK